MKRPPFETIALVLQGGGALGAYQAGVFEGLDAAGVVPDWVAGTSIGAINAALIAGNPPELRVERLREFWDTVTAPPWLPATAPAWAAAVEQAGEVARSLLGGVEALRAVAEGQRGFFVPRLAWPGFEASVPIDRLSLYDTAPLRATLERLVDFDRINHPDSMRLTVSAVDVETANLDWFDSQRGDWAGRIGPEHIMASGALPPAFAAVPIGRRHYWDGGLVSNTPLATVLDDEPRRDTLAFQVDLWSAKGALPRNLFDIEERGKDIRFSSRTRAVTRQFEREQHLRRLLREVLAQVPAKSRRDAWCREAAVQASDRRFNVVHLIYREKPWDHHHKDYEFSALSRRDHWASGLADIRGTLAHPDWLEPPTPSRSSVTHDLHRLAPAQDPMAPLDASQPSDVTLG